MAGFRTLASLSSSRLPFCLWPSPHFHTVVVLSTIDSLVPSSYASLSFSSSSSSFSSSAALYSCWARIRASRGVDDLTSKKIAKKRRYSTSEIKKWVDLCDIFTHLYLSISCNSAPSIDVASLIRNHSPDRSFKGWVNIFCDFF